jgi:hypothetical protein
MSCEQKTEIPIDRGLETARAVAKAVSQLAGYALKESWERGNDIEIPSLGIVIPGKGKENKSADSVKEA